MPTTVWAQAAVFMSRDIITSLLTGLLLKTGLIFDSGYAITFLYLPFFRLGPWGFFAKILQVIHYLFNTLFFSLIQPMSASGGVK